MKKALLKRQWVLDLEVDLAEERVEIHRVWHALLIGLTRSLRQLSSPASCVRKQWRKDEERSQEGRITGSLCLLQTHTYPRRTPCTNVS